MKHLLFISLFFATCFADAAVVIIAHPENQAALTETELQRIYTGRSNTLSNGSTITPLNLSDGNPLRNQFDEQALGRSSSQIKAYWSKLVFTGKGTPPKEVSSENDVIELVLQNPAMIGYVADTTDTGGAKILLRVE